MYIFNEQELISEIIRTGQKPDDIGFSHFVTMLAKAYFKPDYSVNDLVLIVLQGLRYFDLGQYQEYMYKPKVVHICKDVVNNNNRELKKIDYIPIYESDIDTLSEIDDIKKRKVLFTIIAISRYMNCDGWTNTKKSQQIHDLFRRANVNATNMEQFIMIGDLCRSGYIRKTKKIDSQNIQVLFDHFGEEVYKITTFEDLGKQYMCNFEKNYIKCECCGRLTRVSHTGRKPKYCKRCSSNVNRDKTKDRMFEMRHKDN